MPVEIGPRADARRDDDGADNRTVATLSDRDRDGLARRRVVGHRRSAHPTGASAEARDDE